MNNYKNSFHPSAVKRRDCYCIKPDASIIQREFGYFTFDRWRKNGDVPDVGDEELNIWLAKEFDYDDQGDVNIWGLGWCEAEFSPIFEKKVLEDRGEYEVIQDAYGRSLLVFKGRRTGFMPEYIDHPVKDIDTWEKNCKWRMNPDSDERLTNFKKNIENIISEAEKGKMVSQRIVGGYMYLRSLIGPVELLYKFYDEPELVHDCMKTWFELADSVISKYQKHVSLDEVFIAEDICYNGGALISPDMMREFLFPYYQQLLTNIKKRQLDKSRHLYFQVDTDGRAEDVIPLYKELGMDVMSPFEAASGSDVVKIGKKYPDLVIQGGIDKRVLAAGKDAIDKHIDYILPAMKKRGGYIPTCDHGVPEEVSFNNFAYYRKRLLDFR